PIMQYKDPPTKTSNQKLPHPYTLCSSSSNENQKRKFQTQPRKSQQKWHCKCGNRSPIPNPTPPLLRVFFFTQQQQNQRANRTEIAKFNKQITTSIPTTLSFINPLKIVDIGTSDSFQPDL
ncbi:hypothetical protein AABB24_030715, partial [Solanum stoloniferum]